MWLKRNFYVLLLFIAVSSVDCGKAERRRSNGKQGLKFLKSHRGIGTKNSRRNAAAASNSGLWPSVFNLATKADISANATCGQKGREEFCRMSDNGKGRCGICDNASPDTGKRHSIDFAIDGSNRWWQSPALYYGPENEFVTITIDLKQVYQIAYVIVKMANSPRPGTWILERSIDGESFEPWQFFARSDMECLERFGIPATKGKPQYFTDFEVICTSFYSRLTPLENGEIHTSLIQGRPGANETSPELVAFTRARYVRLRLMGLRGAQEPIPRWLSHDIWKDKRLFYAIRDISIGGQCVCNGHAESCRHNVASGHPECECGHHTCGPNCDKCCPMFNQRQWGSGSARDARQCLPCNCHGHATSCHYDDDVDRSGLSLDVHGNYQGGGVCDNCTDNTTGINCDKCQPGFFRPPGVLPDVPKPCFRCECDVTGSTASCVQYGPDAGTCLCRDGFTGDRCDACASGHRGFPACELCPCDAKGVAGLGDCEGECVCKANVEGKYCDRCKSGHFGLRNDIPEGCLSCFCSGVTTLCESAIVIPQKVGSLKEWQITDLKVSRAVRPNWNGQSVFSLGNYDFPGIKSLYWLAPEDYLGNKLEAYNSNFIFTVQWVVMRGDTSGETTRGPNIVFVGNNGLKIAYGDDSHTSAKTTFQIKLSEPDWYHVPDNITDITRLDRSMYHGKAVSRREFLSVLADLRHILLRSTFHTDQIEALLEQATLNLGEEEDGYSSVERCSCPSGYTGLSCESCSFGYVRIYANDSTSPSPEAFCAKCDCNGHSPTCNSTTGECFCEHNTLGDKCERCTPGYYGNPIRGTPEDCKRCACPLLNEENNFSPSCQLDYFSESAEDEGSYVCTQCPKGYTGDHCEICDDGFFGNPMEIGNSCQPCDCNGGPCDRKTGQCLSCKGNTEGWKCEKCKAEHYGEPSLSNCKACECDPIGTVSKQCDNQTGQCECKDKFTGRTCDECEVGFGNVTALCTPCSCNPIGSKSKICDTHTGFCDCLPGVEGFHCDACQNLFYGFSETGCQACTCDPDGSKFSMCNEKTGECVCHPHYTGKNCAVCEDGHWKHLKKCTQCKCNEHGTLKNTSCDKETGKCHCKAGVTGTLCDTCLPDHYGTVKAGCKKCEPCDKKGHICDPINGKCFCPLLTTGNHCEKCAKYAWGYEPTIGCKACGCSTTGSSNLQCDQTKGKCTCKTGYEGEKCNRCGFGYYGYPNCSKCECDPSGTEEGGCQSGLCRCNDDGSCRCKENVQGRNCDRCKQNNYGLTKENPKGCTNCFCFGRSRECEDAQYHWSKTTIPERSVEDNNEITADELMLPSAFMGDLTTSYGGYLVVTVAGGFFDVYLEGNSVQLHSVNNNNELQLIESGNWRVISRNPKFPNSCIDNLTRACFMVVLQKVTSFLVKANNRIKGVLLDKAKNEESTYSITHTIEKCQCPKEYTGPSCQNPNRGYYRGFPEDSRSPWIDVVIGIARKCNCGGHSDECDSETGHCQNCEHHTTGINCEKCDDGFYMDKHRNCAPCLCPSAEQNNAKSCFPIEDSFECVCKEGYRGNFCQECDRKFYKPQNSTVCEPCNCNRHGIIPGDPGSCDKFGICHCREGFTGIKCDQCIEERKYIKNGVCELCDECTMKLFDEIDRLKEDVEGIFDMFKKGIGPPWNKLTEYINNLDGLSEKYYDQKEKVEALLERADIDGYRTKVARMEKKLDENDILAENNVIKTDKLYKNSSKLLEETGNLSKKLVSLIQSLENFGTKHINLKEALKSARHILKEIEDASEKFNSYSDKTFSFCAKVTEKVNALYKPPPDFPEDALSDLQNRLQDLVDIVSYVDNMTKLADAKNTENSKRIVKVKEKIEILKSKNKNLENSVSEIIEKSDAIEDTMEQLGKVYAELKEVADFDEFKEMENRVRRHMKEIPDIEQLYARAIEHVQDLENKVNHYQSLFNFTKDEWKKINASGAYEAIINGIKEARTSVKLSKEILKNAIKLIDPESTDNLDVKTNLAHTYSDRLKQRINNLKDISKNLGEIQNKLVKLKYGILKNGKSNNDLTQILHKIDSDITSQSERVADLEEAMKNASGVSEGMRHIEKQLEDLNFDKQFVLMKKLQKYAELTEQKEIADFIGNLSSTRKKLHDLNILPPVGDTVKSEERGSRLNHLRNNMKILHDKIKQAKQHVDVIDVAMNLTDCQMMYKVSDSQMFQSISITFKCRNCVLFKWSNSLGKVLKVVVDHGKPKVISKNKEIVIPNSEDKERTIDLQKVGALLKVQLNEIERSERIEGLSVISPEDEIEIGSLGKVRDSYVYKVLLNGNNFGLWKFRQTRGNCAGQRRDTASDENNKNSYFNGKGYREYGINYSLNPKKLALKFFFKTFDENSTIYVAAHNKTCSFIALYLEHGHVKLAIRHSNGRSVLLEGKERVNDAEKHEVEIGMTYNNEKQTYNLVVDGKMPLKHEEKLNRKHVFKIKEARHYLGGVPPTFNRTCVPINTTSLLGFVGQTSQKEKLTNETISYGVISRDVIDFSQVWIHKNGYVNMSCSKEELNSISFTLRPTSPDGLIMTFNEDDNSNNISLSQKNLVINGFKYDSTSLNLDDYNSVEVRMDKKKSILTINGKTEDLKDHGKIAMECIQIGGEGNGFSGGIYDVMINDRSLSFNATSVKAFSNVEMGREKPLPRTNINVKSLTMLNLTNTMQNTERCVEFDSYNIIPDAVKYGDKPNSYTHIKTNFWKSNYTLQFDFRTFYPNGVFFISSNKKMNYIFLELKDGQLRLNIRGKKKKVKSLPIASDDKLNDGDWHNIRFTRKSKKLSVVLDNRGSKPSRINVRIKPRDEIFFGGVPSKSQYMLSDELKDKLHPFRGCIKALKINNEPKFSLKNGNDVTHSNVTQCFSNVEEGAYFSGKSFAIYRDDFQVSEMLELSFEFRTSEQNGILLSVSNHGDYPALSVELQNGAIVMAVNVGNGVVSNVTNNLDSDFSLCNNRWHNVTALYSTSELTVNVDGIRKSWVQSDVNSTMDEMEAPLYIGGLPDDAPIGTLKSLTNFKGCIRKLKIENQLMDWSDMEELNNVLLNSCPLEHG